MSVSIDNIAYQNNTFIPNGAAILTVKHNISNNNNYQSNTEGCARLHHSEKFSFLQFKKKPFFPNRNYTKVL